MDAGSTDNTINVVKELAEVYQNLDLIDAGPAGPGQGGCVYWLPPPPVHFGPSEKEGGAPLLGQGVGGRAPGGRSSMATGCGLATAQPWE